MTERGDDRSEIKPLTSLRGIAALWVLFHHITEIEGSKASIKFDSFFLKIVDSGWFGVDIFFILSGHILTRTYFYRKETLKNFYIRRFARIYPLYIISIILILIMVIISAEFNFKLNRPEMYTLKSFVFSVLMVQAIFFKLPPWNFVSWSLSFEVLCYAFFPFLLKHIPKKSPLIIWAYFVFSFIVYLSIGVIYKDPTNEFPAFVRAFSAFSCGVLGFFVINFWKPPSYLAGISVSVIILLAGLSSAAVYMIPAVILLVLALSDADGLTEKLLSNSVLVRIGTISYSIYLLQIPIYYVFNRIWPAALSNSPIAKLSMVVIYSAIVILIANLSYRYIERPSRRWIIARFVR